MLRNLPLSLLLGLALLTAPQLRSEEWGELRFTADEGSFWGEQGVELRVYCSIPYDQLRWVSRENAYLARIYITAVCLDRKGDQKAGDIWDRDILVKNYEETRLRSRSLADSLSFPVDPGKYTFRVEVRDRHSQRRGVKEVKVEVRDLKAGSLAVSDLHFLAPSQSGYLFNPGRTYDGSSPLIVSFEIYRFYSTKYALNEYWRVDDRGGRTVSEGDSSIIAPAQVNREILEVPLNSLSAGEYTLIVSVEDKEGRERRETRGIFTFQPPVFLSQEGYLRMVDQLEYIAKSDELRRLREAKPEEREKLWEEFWKERDPSPGTERNEARENYFERVDYANRYFSSQKDGWRTDMGRIYITYGRPDETERHPFDLDSPPYEIWYYYGKGLKFIFLDEHGLGDYRLVYPRGR